MLIYVCPKTKAKRRTEENEVETKIYLFPLEWKLTDNTGK